MNKPAKAWILGSLSSLAVLLILAAFLPEYELNSSTLLIYEQGEQTPENVSGFSSITNTDLLKRIGIFLMGYWSVFSMAYLLLNNSKLSHSRGALIHFQFTLAASVFIIPLNKFIISKTESRLSDMYWSAKVTPVEFREFELGLALTKSLTTPTSVVGLLLLFAGIIVFSRNMIVKFHTSKR